MIPQHSVKTESPLSDKSDYCLIVSKFGGIVSIFVKTFDPLVLFCEDTCPTGSVTADILIDNDPKLPPASSTGFPLGAYSPTPPGKSPHCWRQTSVVKSADIFKMNPFHASHGFASVH